MDGGASLGGRGRQTVLPGVAELPRARTSKEAARANWLNRLYPALADLSPTRCALQSPHCKSARPTPRCCCWPHSLRS